MCRCVFVGGKGSQEVGNNHEEFLGFVVCCLCAACLAGYLKGRLNPEALPVFPVEWPQFTGANLIHRRGEQRGSSSVWICKVLLTPVSELWRPPGHPALQSARMGSGSSDKREPGSLRSFPKMQRELSECQRDKAVQTLSCRLPLELVPGHGFLVTACFSCRDPWASHTAG